MHRCVARNREFVKFAKANTFVSFQFHPPAKSSNPSKKINKLHFSLLLNMLMWFDRFPVFFSLVLNQSVILFHKFMLTYVFIGILFSRLHRFVNSSSLISSFMYRCDKPIYVSGSIVLSLIYTSNLISDHTKNNIEYFESPLRLVCLLSHDSWATPLI